MNEEIKEKTVILPPFKHFIMTVGAIPTSYLESMTYYEMLVWFTNYLGKTVIPAINENGEAVTELQNLFRELQDYVNNYFDNLDVQEEINNKLDDMVEAGTLQEIIADYLNSKAVFGFDNISDMKNASNLIDGSYARTLGYHTKNDGGSALYKIRTITNDDVVDEMFIIEMKNDETLIAELITINVNIKQLGAIENEDITDIVEASLNKLGYANLSEGIYKCNINIDNDDYIKIKGNNTILIPENSTYPIINIECNSITKLKSIESVIFNLDNNEIGLSIKLPSFVDNYYPQMINIKNIKANCANTFVGKVINLEYLRELNIENIYIKRNRVDDSSRTGTGIDCLSCMNLNIKDSNIGFLDKAIYIHNGTMSSEGIQIDNVEMFFNNYGVYAISNSTKAILNLRIENCMIDQVQTAGIYIDGVTTTHILNNWIGTNETNANSIDISSTNRENYGTIISNNTIWHNNQNDSYCIVFNRSSNFNIRNTNINSNNIFNYHLYAINDLSTTAISNLRINGNTFETTSSDTNRFLHYTTLPNNIIINSNYNGGSPFFDSNILNLNNNLNMGNRRVLTSSDITLGSTIHNNTNKYLLIIVGAHNTSETESGRIVVFTGETNNVSERYTQKIYNGTGAGSNQTCIALINPYSFYAINPGANVSVDNVYGIYV